MRIILAMALSIGLGVAVRAEPASYRLLSVEAGEARSVVAVGIDHRLGEAELAEIAAAARARANGRAPRILVKFYLGRPQGDDTAWATATFAPDMKLVVNGLSATEADLLAREARLDTRAKIGSWLMEPPAAPGRLTIFRDKGHAFAEWRLRGGHRTVDELAESHWNGNTRLDVRGDASQHYVVTRAGVLELRDKTRLIAVGQRIDMAPPAVAAVESAAEPARAGDATVSVVARSAGSVVVRAVEVERPATAAAREKTPVAGAQSAATSGTQRAEPGPNAVAALSTATSYGAAPIAAGADQPAANLVAVSSPTSAAPLKAAQGKRWSAKAARKQVVGRTPPARRKDGKERSYAAIVGSQLGQR